MFIEKIELKDVPENMTRFVFSTDFESIANTALELSVDADEGIRKFKATNIIMDVVEAPQLALAIEGLLWSRNEKAHQANLARCREIYVDTYGSLEHSTLLCLTPNVGVEWWRKAS